MDNGNYQQVFYNGVQLEYSAIQSCIACGSNLLSHKLKNMNEIVETERKLLV